MLRRKNEPAGVLLKYHGTAPLARLENERQIGFPLKLQVQSKASPDTSKFSNQNFSLKLAKSRNAKAVSRGEVAFPNVLVETKRSVLGPGLHFPVNEWGRPLRGM